MHQKQMGFAAALWRRSVVMGALACTCAATTSSAQSIDLGTPVRWRMVPGIEDACLLVGGFEPVGDDTSQANFGEMISRSRETPETVDFAVVTSFNALDTWPQDGARRTKDGQLLMHIVLYMPDDARQDLGEIAFEPSRADSGATAFKAALRTTDLPLIAKAKQLQLTGGDEPLEVIDLKGSAKGIGALNACYDTLAGKGAGQ